MPKWLKTRIGNTFISTHFHWLFVKNSFEFFCRINLEQALQGQRIRYRVKMSKITNGLGILYWRNSGWHRIHGHYKLYTQTWISWLLFSIFKSKSLSEVFLIKNRETKFPYLLGAYLYIQNVLFFSALWSPYNSAILLLESWLVWFANYGPRIFNMTDLTHMLVV